MTSIQAVYPLFSAIVVSLLYTTQLREVGFHKSVIVVDCQCTNTVIKVLLIVVGLEEVPIGHHYIESSCLISQHHE